MAIDFSVFNNEDLDTMLDIARGSSMEIKVRKEIQKRKDFLIQQQFTSSRLPDYNSDYMYRAKQLSLELDVSRVERMWKSACFDSRSNIKGDFYTGVFGSDNSQLDKKWMHNLGYISLLFQDENLRKNYEGTYNTVNYLLNGIYKELNRRSGSIETVDDLFYVLPEKEELVKDKFSDIVDYLWTIRSEIPDSRSSIGNHGLSMNRSKVKKKFTSSQNALIEAVAYGCTLDELEKGNYEGAKRLIYVPHNKMKR